MSQHAYKAAEFIREFYPDFTPKIGIMLSSGLNDLVEKLTQAKSIDYTDLPGFPQLSVKGHAGKLYLGYLANVPVVCLLGRCHSYESLEKSYGEVKTYIRTLKLLGCEYYLATNVSGSLRPDFEPGSQVLIHDHINFQPGNPLAGPNDDEFGPRFLPLDKAYHPEFNAHILDAAKAENILLHTGTYISVLGPSYETAAEIRAFRQWGAEVVGMSTVPEVIVANHCGLKTAVVATITNFATGIATEAHDHDKVVEQGKLASEKVCRLITSTVKKL